jgi:hypothetical protein
MVSRAQVKGIKHGNRRKIEARKEGKKQLKENVGFEFTSSTGCALYRVPEHGSFIALGACLRREIS